MSPRAHRLFLAAALAFVPAVASAATPGVQRGTVMLSAERLFGLSFSRAIQGSGAGEVDRDQTHFGLALAPLSPAPHVYLLPRLAFDYALIDGLTVGGALGFGVGEAGSGDSKPSFTTVMIAPRIGYVLGLTKPLGLWLRGGFTYFNVTSHADPDSLPANTEVSATLWGLALNIEPTLLISPFEHVGFTVSGILDLPMSGKQSSETTVGSVTTTRSIDYTIRNFGLVAGMVVMF